MEELKSIKDIYKPIQPVIQNTNTKISYKEIKPHNGLQNYIYCYWQLKTHSPLHESFIYRIVADGCMDIFWEAGSPQQNFITGFANQHTEFPLFNSFNYFGIRFLPTAFPILFKTDSSQLTNKFEDLSSVAPSLSKQLRSQSEAIFSLQEIKPKLDALFLQIINNTSFMLDSRLYEAIDIILKLKGNLHIEKDLEVGLSPRQLRRLFNFYIGDTAKIFSKVVRFQNLLSQRSSSKSRKEDKTYFDLGYYDQSHFIKEFKHLYGSIPSQSLK